MRFIKKGTFLISFRILDGYREVRVPGEYRTLSSVPGHRGVSPRDPLLLWVGDDLTLTLYPHLLLFHSVNSIYASLSCYFSPVTNSPITTCRFECERIAGALGSVLT